MKNLPRLLILGALIVSVLSSSCRAQSPSTYHTKNDMRLQRCFPELRSGEKIVFHKGFALVYNEKYEQAAWVGYMLTRDRVNAQGKKSNNFREDPALATRSAQLDDYHGSGFDRGHLCPSGSMKWDFTVNDETFFLSNMSPQDHSFNSGIWNTIEDRVRNWSRTYDTIYVFTGPIFSDDMTTIGRNRVAVPKAFYKVVYCPASQQAIGLIVPHIQQKAQWHEFAVPVDEVETRTGINFLKGIANEDSVEKSFNISFWQHKAQKQKRKRH